MTTAYTSLLGLALPVTGELSGTWGDTVNNSITSLLDTSVAGTTNVSTDTDVTLTTTTGAANTARQAILLFSGARTALRTVTAPAQSKIYTVINATTGGFSVKLVGSGPTTGVTIVAGESAVCAWNGSDFVKVSNTGGSASFTNVTVSGTTTLSGLTASTALALNASKEVVSVTNTGTGNNVLSASPTLTGTIGAAALTLSSDLTLSGGTANGVAYLNGSKVVTSSSALTFDGANFTQSANGGLNLTVRNVTSTSDAYVAVQNTLGSSFFGINATGPYIYTASNIPLQFIVNNAEQMRLTSTGLGIGTSSPSEKLAVAGNVTADIYKLRSNQSAPASTDAFIYRPADNTIGFGTASAEKMRLDSSGNLGIGTSSPTQALSIYRGTSVAAFIDLAGNANTGGTSSVVIGQNSDDGGYFWNRKSSFLSFGTANTERMRLDSSGNLGLGVTPSAWGVFKGFDIASNAAISNGGTFAITSNAYYNGANWIYKSTAVSTLYQQQSGAHQWYNAPSGTAGNAITFTQAMTLDASGNLLLGTTTQLGSAKATFKAGSTLPAISIGMANSSGTYAAQIFFDGDNTDSGSIDVNNDANTTAYTTSSDYRLKLNVQPIANALTKVGQLNPVTWNWKKNPSLNSSGFIAHELQAVCPDAVTGYKDEVDEEGNPKYQGIDTSFLVATVVAALQELKAEFDAYKASHP